MTHVHERHPSANIPVSSPVPPARRPLRWDDPADGREWLDAFRTGLDDLAATARDATRRPRKRVLSRAELRRRSKEATRALADLLDAASRGLPPRGDTP